MYRSRFLNQTLCRYSSLSLSCIYTNIVRDRPIARQKLTNYIILSAPILWKAKYLWYVCQSVDICRVVIRSKIPKVNCITYVLEISYAFQCESRGRGWRIITPIICKYWWDRPPLKLSKVIAVAVIENDNDIFQCSKAFANLVFHQTSLQPTTGIPSPGKSQLSTGKWSGQNGNQFDAGLIVISLHSISSHAEYKTNK